MTAPDTPETWTATERKGGMSGRIATDIVDEADQLICRLYAWADEPAAVQQMRARARLIVQAEAMRDVLKELHAQTIKFTREYGNRLDVDNPLYKKVSAIIAATEGDHG